MNFFNRRANVKARKEDDMANKPKKYQKRYKKIPDMIEYNGCKIVLLKNGKRCKKGYKCEKYLDCLNHIAVLGAKGWETITV